MRMGLKYTATAAAVLMLAGSQSLFAFCTEADNVFPMFQCGTVSWFAPLPAAGPGGKPTGTVTGVWWQLGYGNFAVNNGTINATLEGVGITPGPATFSGNDGGGAQAPGRPAGLILTDAAVVGPQAAGGFCLNYENSWAIPGTDGCADNPRVGTGLQSPPGTYRYYDNDNLLNREFGPHPVNDVGTGSTEYLLDYPTAFILREGSGQFFSWAIVASAPRTAPTEGDASQGTWDLGRVTNGMTNPISGQPDIIPWQPVPRPNVNSAVIDTGTNTVDLALSWTNPTVIHDGSNRPSSRLFDPNGGTGVGVLNQISAAQPLIRYRLEMLNLTTLPPGSVNPSTGEVDPNVLANATFTPVPGVPNPILPSGPTQNVSVLDVPRDHALRLRTLLGRIPRTTALSVANCRLGRCGDLGIEPTNCGGAAGCPVSPPLTVVGGALISERAIDMRASKAKGDVVVTFRTTSEQTVTGIEILAVGTKGDSVIRSLSPQQGTTGVGAEYEVTLGMGELKGAKSLKVRLNGPGFTSGPFPVE